MADVPKLQPGILQGMHYNTQEWLRQSTDSINARFALVLDNQNPNIIYAGPGSGAAAVPGFRSLVAADLPTLTPAMLPSLVGSSENYNYAFNSTGVLTNTVVFTSPAGGMYMIGYYVYWTNRLAGIGSTGLAFQASWNDGFGSHSLTSKAVADANFDPVYETQCLRIGSAQSLTFSTTISINPNAGVYQVYVSAQRIG